MKKKSFQLEKEKHKLTPIERRLFLAMHMHVLSESIYRCTHMLTVAVYNISIVWPARQIKESCSIVSLHICVLVIQLISNQNYLSKHGVS